MDKKRLLYYLIIKELRKISGVDIAAGDISSFDSRLITQKTIYLLQILGLNLEYTFRWNTNGPYSDELSEHIKTINPEKIPEEWQEFRLSNRASDLVADLIKKVGANNLNDPDFLEALGSLIFIKQNLKKSKSKIDRTTLLSRFKESKPKFANNRYLIDRILPISEKFLINGSYK